MKKITLLFVAMMAMISSYATVYYSQATGTYNTLGNWNSSRLGGGSTPLNFTTSGDIFIVQGTGNGGTSPHTMTVTGASITFGANVKVQIENGGNMICNNSITMNAAATLQVDGGGTFTWNNTGAFTNPFAGIESFAPTSNFIIQANSGTGPTTATVTGSFGNLTYNGTVTLQCKDVLPDIAGNLSEINTGELRLAGSVVSGGSVLNVGGNLIISSGILSFGNGSTAGTINLGGDFNMSGGVFQQACTGGVSGTPKVCTVNFNKAGTQQFIKTGGTITSASTSFREITFNVNSGATLDFGTNVLGALATSTVNFVLSSGAGLITKNTGGITTAPTASGSIQNLTGTRTFSTGADYTYNGTAAQTLGTGFTGARNLTINNTSGAAPAVSFNISATISGNFTVTAGDVRNSSGAARTITMTGASAALAVGGAITGTNVGVGNDLNLVYTNTTGTLTISGAGSLCRFLNCTNTNTGSKIILTRTLEVMFGTFTENGTLQINSGGAVSTAVSAVAPTYGASSTLVYNSGTSYGVAGEWTSTGGSAGLGIPKDVIVQGNTTVTTTAARGFAGALLVDVGSTFAAGGGTLTATGGALIDGTFQINQSGFATGSFVYGSAGTLIWNNTSGVYGPVNTHTYFPSTSGPFNVSVLGAGGVDFGSMTRTVAGAFTVAAAISNYCNLTFNGTVALNSGYNFSGSCGSGPFYACASTLTYNSGGTPGRGGEWGTGATPGNVTLSNSTTLNGNIGTGNICGDLTIGAGSSLYMDFGSSGNSALNVSGNVVLAGNLSLGFGVGGDMTVGGNWTHTTGTFATNSRLVSFTAASGNQTITNAAGETFAYVTVNKAAGNLVLANNVTVNNTLTLTSGNVEIGSNTLTLNGAFSRTSGNLAGSTAANLTIGGTAGSLFFDAAGTNNYLKAFTLNTGSSATLGNALNIADFGGGSEGSVTVAGTATLTTGGFLTLKSTANGTARVGQGRSAGGYISGNVTVERFIPQNTYKGWRLLAAPTTGQSINAAWQEGQADSLSNTNPGYGVMISGPVASPNAAGLDGNTPGASLLRYDPATDNLIKINNTFTTNTNTWPGYFLYIRGDRTAGQFGGLGINATAATSTTLRSSGPLYTGDQTSIPSVNAGEYGLVGNPYASRLDMRNITLGGGMVDAFEVWDPKLLGGSGYGAYQTFTKSGADYLVTPGGGSYGTSGSVQNWIESGAAFFVHATGSTGTIVINETAKASGSAVVNRPSDAPAEAERLITNLFAINASTTDLADGNMILLGATNSNGFDINDVRKSPNFGENIGILANGNDLVVERKALFTANDTVFYNLSGLRQQSYKIQILPEAISTVNLNAYLEDLFLNTSTQLSLGSMSEYTFTVTSATASKAANRFRIVFKNQAPLPVTIANIRAYSQANNIAVEWKVESQVNIARYEIEKSLDGRNFIKVGTQLASNSNSASVTYSWLDLNAVRGANYFRVKCVDNDGRYKYTIVVRVNLGDVKPSITVSPNPVQGSNLNVVFTNQEKGNYQIRLVNEIGQIVFNKISIHAGGSTTQSFVLPSQNMRGVYQLEVTGPNKVKQVQKVIINSTN